MDARFIVMFHLILSVQGNARDQEPRCYSSFDFQEKLLEKMVSLTMTVNAMKDNFDTKLQELNEASEKLKEDKLAMESGFTKLESQLKHEFKHHEEKFKEDKLTMESGFTKLESQLKYEFKHHEEKLKEHTLATESDFTQLESQLKHEIKDSVEKLKEDKLTMESNITKLETHLKHEIKHAVDDLDANTQKIDDLLRDTDAKFGRLSQDFHTMANVTMKKIQGSIKPNVAFLARTVSDTSPGRNTHLVFTNAIHNTDNSYSTSTGEFTAPVGGTYWFSTQICGFPGKAVNFRIYVNDVMMSDTTHYDSDDVSCTSSNTVAILSKGDRVYVKSGPRTSGGNVIYQDANRWTMFMGSLVN